MQETKRCQQGIHIYNFLETQEMENKQTAWIFFAKSAWTLDWLLNPYLWHRLINYK